MDDEDDITRIEKYVIEQSQAMGVDLNEDMNQPKPSNGPGF